MTGWLGVGRSMNWTVSLWPPGRSMCTGFVREVTLPSTCPSRALAEIDDGSESPPREVIDGVSHPGFFGGEGERLKGVDDGAVAQEGVKSGRVAIITLGNRHIGLTGRRDERWSGGAYFVILLIDK